MPTMPRRPVAALRRGIGRIGAGCLAGVGVGVKPGGAVIYSSPPLSRLFEFFVSEFRVHCRKVSASYAGLRIFRRLAWPDRSGVGCRRLVPALSGRGLWIALATDGASGRA